MPDTAKPSVSSTIEFHNADAYARPAILRFDLAALPAELSLTFRLTEGVSPLEIDGATPRPLSTSDDSAPPGFGSTVYDVNGGGVAEAIVELDAFAMITSFFSVRTTGVLPAGRRYRFDIQQFSPDGNQKDGQPTRLRGGSTFVVPVAGDPPAPPVPEPEWELGDKQRLWAPPWLAADSDRRFQEAFHGKRPGPHVTEMVVVNDNADYAGPCPITITFTATLAVEGDPGVLCYTWVRNDDGVGPVENLTIPSAGIYELRTTWTLGGTGFNYEGWQALRLFGEVVETSNKSAFKVQCTS